MPLLYAIVGTLWLAVALARPRQPALIRNEAAWLVYLRLSGAWQRLWLTAVIVTLAVALIGVIALTRDANDDLFRLRAACVGTAVAVGGRDDACWLLDPQGGWHLRYFATQEGTWFTPPHRR